MNIVDNKEWSAEERLHQSGLVLPKVPAPVGHFQLGVIEERFLYLSGQGPVLASGQLATGKVGADVTVDEAYQHARRTGMTLLAAIREILGSLDHVQRIVRIFGMVNAIPDFTDHPQVINGCSDLMHEVFGHRGQHARSAVGMSSLPGNITVEIEAVVFLKADRQ